MGFRWRVAGAAVLGGGLTAAVLLFPGLRFAYLNAQVHLALEVAEGVIGVGVAYLVLGRVRAHCRAGDLALLAALCLSVAANLPLGAMVELMPAVRTAMAEAWAPLTLRTIGAGLLAAAPFLHHPLREPERSGRLVIGAVAALAALVGTLSWALAGWLPEAVPPGISPLDSARPLLAGHPAVMVLQTVMMSGYAVGAAGFARLARRERDEFLSWVAAGVTLGAFARLNYLLFPSLYTDWVYTGDVLRLAFWLLLLAGAARELRLYWSRLADAAVAEERRRIARDLHDGLAQELAFLVSQTSSLGDSYEVELRRLRGAAERALYESRRAIALLSGRGDERLPALLSRAAEEVAHRYDVRVRLSGDFPATLQEREELARIVREAVTNAARHGKAKTIRLELEQDAAGRRLRVHDDGLGFVPGEERGDGFGMLSMRERTEAMGGALTVTAAPQAGVTVEVTLP